MGTLIVLAILGIFSVYFLYSAFLVVPQQTVAVVERLGKFHSSLNAGLHFLIPFVDRVAYKVPLQEIPLDTDPQNAITKDNVTVSIDGVLYFRVTDPKAAAYGTSNFRAAIENLAKTSLRSEVGKRELDKLLEDRQAINTAVVQALDEASTAWGVKVLRYEVKDITPPAGVLKSMEMQLTAEREKRALIAKSEGQRTEQVNLAEGAKAAAIADSEGQKQAAINEAQGKAEAIRVVAEASANAIEMIAKAIQQPGGHDAINLSVAEKYVQAFEKVAKESSTLILPADMGNLSGLIASSMKIVQHSKKD